MDDQAFDGPGDGELDALRDCLARLQSGDLTARDDFIAIASRMFEKKINFVLRVKNQRIAAYERPSDVSQEILLRLLDRLRTNLDEIRADDLEGWLACWLAMNLRWVLADLARKHLGVRGARERDQETGAARARGRCEPGFNDTLVRQSSGPERLRLRRAMVHELIDRLPEKERVVVELREYPRRSFAEVGRLLDIDRETVSRRYNSALERLGNWLRESDVDFEIPE